MGITVEQCISCGVNATRERDVATPAGVQHARCVQVYGFGKDRRRAIIQEQREARSRAQLTVPYDHAQRHRPDEARLGRRIAAYGGLGR